MGCKDMGEFDRMIPGTAHKVKSDRIMVLIVTCHIYYASKLTPLPSLHN
jgi:hypothetical protein